MAHPSASHLVAVDVGNSRIKLGLFAGPSSEGLPSPVSTLSLSPPWNETELAAWLSADVVSAEWYIASVNRPAAAWLEEWLSTRKVRGVRKLAHGDLPLTVELARPDQVGIDRLVDAVAANQVREPQSAAVIVDFGSAITVDLVTPAGAFAGGAILPGMAMAAGALHEFTDLLPQVEVDRGGPPLGKSTSEAIAAGLYYGSAGAICELAARMTKGAPARQIILTGGAAGGMVETIRQASGLATKHVPHLTLAGIAISARHASAAKAEG